MSWTYPPIEPGTVVLTKKVDNLDNDWTEEALIHRKFGVKGVVKKHHDSHGLCYDVTHEDGSQGCYDPEELEIVKAKNYIWWVNQKDCEAIGELPACFPDYLQEEFSGRVGRPGRGRLWTADQFGHAEVNPWPETPLAKALGGDYGGIVIRREDVPLFERMPGIVTDDTLKKVV